MAKVTRRKKVGEKKVKLTADEQHELLLMIRNLSQILADSCKGKRIPRSALRRVSGRIAGDVC